MNWLARFIDWLITHIKTITVVLSLCAVAVFAYVLYFNAPTSVGVISIFLPILVALLNAIPEKPDITASISQPRYYFQHQNDNEGISNDFTRITLTVDIASRNLTTSVRNFRVRYNSNDFPASQITTFGNVPLPPVNIDAGTSSTVFFAVDLDRINFDTQFERNCELIFDSIHGTSTRLFFRPTAH